MIVYPMAKGLDKILGVHHHERIQHKDFAAFLNDDVVYFNIQEIFKEYWKITAHLDPLVKYRTRACHHDPLKWALYARRKAINHWINCQIN